MKRTFRILAPLLFLLYAAPAPAASPDLRVPQESYDFGEIYQGATLKHTFRFENAGDAPLQIEKVRTSCGCTAALLSQTEIPPGGEGEVQATFDSTHFRGPVSKTIYLYSNDPQRPVAQLYLRGRVKPEIAQEPQRIDLGLLQPEQEQVAEVVLTNQSNGEIGLSSVQVTAPELEAELSADRLPPGGSARVIVRARPREGRNYLNGYVLIGTTSPNVPELRIPVFGAVKNEKTEK